MPTLPDAKTRAWFEGCKPEFPVGATVRGSAALATRLAKAKEGRRDRDMSMLGKVTGYDELQCRIEVAWDHPLYKGMKNPPVEPLSPHYLEVVPNG